MSSLHHEIECLEGQRNSTVIVLSASHLDIELLPTLYNCLRSIGHVPRLDVVLQSRGGVVNAARRIGLLLRKFTDHLGIIVPYQCESSATILSLAANEIIAGDLAIFSPIDPNLNGADAEGQESAMSSMDIKEFGKMCEDWFNVDSQEAKEQSLSLLCNSIFPPNLTAFYRTTQEVKKIAEELLTFQLPNLAREQRIEIINQLMFGYHSHSFALTKEEMQHLGLNIVTDEQVETIAWKISEHLQQIVGGGLRTSIEQPWNDALLATIHECKIRQNNSHGFMPIWKELDV